MLNAITGRKENLYSLFKKELKQAQEVKIIVAFLKESGVKLIVDDLKKQALKNGAEIKIITGKYLNITEPSALYLLKDKLGDMVDLRFYDKDSISFHPKAYFLKKEEEKVLFIGSSNISASAFTNGVEWNYRMIDEVDEVAYERFEQEFDRIFAEESTVIDEEELRNYASSWSKPQVEIVEEKEEPERPEPRGAQIEALHELKLARKEGVKKGLVVAATGVGKTYLVAFDSIKFDKVLFVAHREEILRQTKKTYESIEPELEVTFFTGEEKDASGDIVLASVQKLRREEYLAEDHFLPDEFDYIVVDEFHHAGADSYLKVLDYFEPEFLLGKKDLEKKLSTHKRADLILRNYRNLAGQRTLGFCASINHARYMAEYFNENNIRAVCVHSSSDQREYFMERKEAVEKLEAGDIDVIFAVDIFNEGVDIPALDTVLFLRPTESYVVFLQQLGRGLREYKEKEYLKVLDFIGNYKRAHYVPFLLAGENPMKKDKQDLKKIDDFDYPNGCQISFDFEVIDLFNEIQKHDSFRDRMEEEYYRLKKYLGRRPLRKDIQEGVDIDTKEYMRRTYHGEKGYLRFLASIDELKEGEEEWLDIIVEKFLYRLERTSMNKSYKIPTLLALLEDGKLQPEVDIEEVGESFMNYYYNYKLHQKDLNNKKHEGWEEWSREEFKKAALENPVHFLTKGRESKFFSYDEINEQFRLSEDLVPYLNEDLAEHFKDILEYRSRRYFSRRFKEEG
ncbi:DEAD/DEAH box helicase family protein [Acetohalobium arabaticum]|uniref:Type III restriction protein res subunit n=1 Tax=Acetohalobium arabaticum (strain ATCC 49924 / DSM 5501 / Z-7288) TaxID=574087 RepID=D9QVC6_ACEAZ|nr:DEAD/DEAH box helicase family protein [Acetohalobium arabaticum]ADL12185.1 type III restriction protein res subunit [Acetohalobium arabaticum DSM 5501]